MAYRNKWEEDLDNEFDKLFEEYVRLKNPSGLFETEQEHEEREEQIQKGKREKREQFRSFIQDFKKRRDYVLKLRKELEILKLKARKDELEQKLIDQGEKITDKDLLELLVLKYFSCV